MRVISVVGQKGGAGKSTVALHVATSAGAAGIPTAIIDTDPQGSAYKWFERREAPQPEITREMDADALGTLANRARANGIGLLIIDTPGKAESVALAACEIADMVLIPTRPTQFDLETLGTAKRIVRLAERLDRSWVVLSQCPTNSRKIVEQGESAVAAYALQLAPVSFYTRADFSYAMSSGLTAGEYDPAGKAAGEAAALFDWIRTQIELVPTGNA